jgi:uncharacterized protein YndB with AHSA1/START domain
MNKLKVTADIPTEIHMTRTFAAPRRLLIQAMTTPELVKRWLGGVRATVVSAEMDRRVGGTYRNVFRLPSGDEFSFSGEIRELSDDRIVYTEVFGDQPGHALVTTTFVEHAGETTMTVVMAFPSQELRDMVLATGMADGAGESYDVLERLVAGL